MLYLTVIFIGSALIITGNSLLDAGNGYVWANNTVAVLTGVIAIIAIDGLSALIIRRLFPPSLFSADHRVFRPVKSEHQFYNRIGIKKWKNKVPELGMFTGFSKGKIQSTSDSDYLSRFLLEANYGVVIHLANAALGFLIFLIPPCSAPSVWIPIFLVNLVLSLMPVAILRYNSYILVRLYKRSLRMRNVEATNT